MLTHKAKKIIAIDFGQGFIKIIYGEHSIGSYKINSYSLKKIALVASDAQAGLINFINSFVQENSISTKDAYLAISGKDAVILKQVVLPELPKEEILQAIKWQLKEEIPFDLSAASLVWQTSRNFSDEDGAKKSELVVAVVKKEIIEQCLATVDKCALSPQNICVSPFSYENILSCYSKRPVLCAVLDIGYKESVLGIYQQGTLRFARKLNFSSDALTQALSTSFVSDEGTVSLSYEDAEKIKIAAGIPLTEKPTIENISATQIISLVRPALEALARDLKLSLDYFTSHFDAERIPLLYITGGGSNLKNLDKYLHNEIGINVEHLLLPQNVSHPSQNKESFILEQNQIANALATILKPASIDLLPPEIKKQKVEFIEKIFLRVTIITAAGIFLSLMFLANFQINDYKKRLANAKLHLGVIGHVKELDKRYGLKASS
jgi:type IV pilus assembly protein PilM